MRILAIETSCDETACAVVEGADLLLRRSAALPTPVCARRMPNTACLRASSAPCAASTLTASLDAQEVKILSNVVVSQVDIFAAYGGVIPEVAARSHLEAMLPVVHKALADAELTKDNIDYIAVTHTPGLLGSLLIGTLTARALAILWGKPLYAVHHLKSHIYANWLSCSKDASFTFSSAGALSSSKESDPRAPEASSAMLSKANETPFGKKQNSPNPEFPLLALVVSGGHTQIIWMEGHNQFEIIGTTRDDAVGECFDKVAKILGLPYPGGPSIAKVSPRNSSKNFATLNGNYKLPIPKVEGLDFSFSGLKTAVLRAVQAELGVPISTPSYELAGKLTEEQRADFAASFQETACEILVEKVKKALEERPETRSVVLAGGVSANARLRERFCEEFGEEKVYFPETKFCGDNAAMVGAAAYFEILSGVKGTDPYSLNIAPRSALD